MTETAYSYCVVREDLTWPQRVVQAGHAWWDASRLPSFWTDREGPMPHFVLLSVKDEDELIALSKRLRRLEVTHVKFYEEDYDLGYTALATAPLTGPGREAFAGMNVLREESDPCCVPTN